MIDLSASIPIKKAGAWMQNKDSKGRDKYPQKRPEPASLRLVKKKALQGVCLLDRNGIILETSREFRELTGFKQGKKQVSWYGLVPPIDRRFIAKEHTSALAGGIRTTYTTYLISGRKKKNLIHVAVSVMDGKLCLNITDIFTYNTTDFIFDTIPDGIIVTDKKGKIILVNTALEKMTGANRSSMIEKNYNDLGWRTGEFRTVKARRIFNIVRTSMEPLLGTERTVERPDGKKIFLLGNTSPILDNNGRFGGIVSVITDITEKKNSERIVEEQNRLNLARAELWKLASNRAMSEDQFINGLIDTIGPALGAERVVYCIVKGNEIIAEAEWKKHRSSPGIKGFRMSSYYFKKVMGSEQEILDMHKILERLSVKETRTFGPTVRMLLRLVGDKPLLVTYFTVSGKVEGVICCLAQDTAIKDWSSGKRNVVKEAAQIVSNVFEVKRVQRDLAESEAKLRGILATAQIGVGLAVDRRMQWFNDSFVSLTGYSAEELTGMDVRSLYATEAEYVETGKIIYGRLNKKIQLNNETRMVRKDGTVIEIYIGGSFLDDKDPGKGLVFTIMDITGIKQNEQKLMKQAASQSALAELSASFFGMEGGDSMHKMKLALWEVGKLAGAGHVFYFKPENHGIAEEWHAKKGGRNSIANPAALHDILYAIKGSAKQGVICINDTSGNFGTHKKELNELKKMGIGAAVNVELAYRGKKLGSLVIIDGAARKDRGNDFVTMVKVAADMIAMWIEREAAADTLKESEEKFRAVFRTSPDAFNLSSMEDGVIADVNEGFCSLSGYRPEEIIGKKVDDTHLWADPKVREKIVGMLVHNGHASNIEAEFLKKDGSIISGIVSANIIKIKGKPYILTVTKDITGRKKAETELRESEEKFRTAFKTSPDAIVITELDNGIFVDVNDGFLQSTGYTRRDVFGRNGKDINLWVCEKDRDFYMETLKRSGLITNFEAPFKLKDGSVHSGLLSARIIRINGRPHVLSITRDITERKKVEEILRESEEKFRIAFMTSPDSININRVSDGMFVDINEGFTKTTGFTADDVKNRTSVEIDLWAKPEDRERLVAGLSEKGYVENLEAVFRRKNGTQLTGLMSASIIVMNGEREILSITRDITERKRTEQGLEENEEKFRVAFMTSPDAVIISRMSDGLIVELNDGFTRLTGYTVDEARGRTNNEFGVFADPAGRERLMEEVKTKGFADNFEVEYCDRTGGIHTGLLSARVIFMNNEPHLLSITRDITDRKTAERQIKESEEKFRMISEQSLLGIAIIQDGRFKYANKAYADINGFTLEEIYRWTQEDYGKIIHPDDAVFVVDQVRRKQSDEPGAVLNYQFRIITGPGNIKWIDLYGKTVNFDGKPADFITQVDITATREAQEKLNRTVDELARSNAELEKFAYVASHDLQEPLRMVSNYVQLLRRRYSGRLDSDADEFIGFAVEGAARMRELIKDLLDYSRIEHAERDFDEINMNEALDDALKLLSGQINESRAKIKHSELPVVRGEKTMLSQLLQNLISNSIKFTKAGFAPRIEVTAKMNGNEWLFRVKDNGIGISPMYFDKIFVIFQRLHTRDEYEGTGIGLAICKKIIERHGGRIWVESNPGEGASFYFTLSV
jgi:PAS domain S-box-containing protein